jgi:hypothetical protein
VSESIAIDPSSADLLTRLSALSADDPVRITLVQTLFRQCLNDGNPNAALALAQLLDEDEALDRALYRLFDEALHTQPDAVYRLVRLRLAAGLDEDWLFRLRQAALAALHIAITDGDVDTVLNWLAHIAREPVAHNLRDVLHHGILAARTRVHEDVRLARGIVLLALKHDAEALNVLLADAAVLEMLPEDLRLLLQGEGDATALLSAYGSDVFLAVLGRAAAQRQGGVFFVEVIEQAWHFYINGAGATLPLVFQPAQMAAAWAENDGSWLANAAFDRLFALALRDSHDTLVAVFAKHLAQQSNMLPRFTGIIRYSQRPAGEIVTLLNIWQSQGLLEQAEVAALLEMLASGMDWSKDAAPFANHWVRLVQSNPAAVEDDERLWQILSSAVEHEDELVVRTAIRPLTARLESIEDEPLLVAALQRMIHLVGDYETCCGFVMEWWLDFVARQPTARLSRIQRALETGRERELGDYQAVIATTSALRRMMGKRTLKQFAEDVHLTLAALELVMNAFDGEVRRDFEFEPAAMRRELELRQTELNDQERQILASDLKELAHLIGVLGDHRSKASLIRREEEVDRHLLLGDQLPHGGVDVLKWMAGFLGGLQNGSDER